jgi:uncharacterized protein YajQ (UPF0234 family)
MMEQYFRVSDFVTLDDSYELMSVVRSKRTSFPNGQQVISYQLQGTDGKVSGWYEQQRLKVICEPGEYTFQELMDILKNQVIDRNDFI